MPPRVSVCMCTFNGTAVVGRAIESILSQTYGDFELIVVDDASSDSTIEVVMSYREPRLRILQNSRNLGNARNRSLAIRASRGDLVKFVDQDDWIAPVCLVEHVNLMDENPGVGFSFSRRAISVREAPSGDEPPGATEGQDLHYAIRDFAEVMRGPALFERFLDAKFRDNWIGEPTSVMLRRACLQRSLLFNRRLRSMVDMDLWLRLMAFFDVGFLDAELATRSVGSASETTAIRALRSDWLDRLWLLEGLSEFGELWDRHPKLAILRRADQKSLVVSMTTGRYRAVRPSDAILDASAYLSHLARRSAGRPTSQFDRL
jgi:glycosyltransferase involved in cell wall biosynthesis